MKQKKRRRRHAQYTRAMVNSIDRAVRDEIVPWVGKLTEREYRVLCIWQAFHPEQGVPEHFAEAVTRFKKDMEAEDLRAHTATVGAETDLPVSHIASDPYRVEVVLPPDKKDVYKILVRAVQTSGWSEEKKPELKDALEKLSEICGRPLPAVPGAVGTHANTPLQLAKSRMDARKPTSTFSSPVPAQGGAAAGLWAELREVWISKHSAGRYLSSQEAALEWSENGAPISS